MSPPRTATLARWGAGLVLALGLHAAAAAAFFARASNEVAESIASAPVILVELAPVAAAPDAPKTDIAPGPRAPVAVQRPEASKEKQAEASKVTLAPEKTSEIAIEPSPVPRSVLTVLPPDKPVEKRLEKSKRKQRYASLPNAPTPVERNAERAVAPAPSSAFNSNAVADWKSRLVAQIERHKSFPAGADGVHGTVQVAFSVDRSGGVHHARVARSSGSNVLDRDALAWLTRAAPLPAPPPEVSGALIPIAVPLRYNAR